MEVGSSDSWYERYRLLVSSYLRAALDPLRGPVYDLCRYHLGWADRLGRPQEGQSGKMLRPVLCLAACRGFAEPSLAVPAAAAIELVHAFSLVHDDIEDGDRERRHIPTLWAIHGVPLALNAGDALYALAVHVLHASTESLPPERVAYALDLFSAACLRLVEGQHEDLEFEAQTAIGLEAYVAMVEGKTGALLALALALGALHGGAGLEIVDQLRRAGLELGLAFQARDDALALWGESDLLGKATGNDLVHRKKSLPVVLASQRGIGPERLREGSVQSVRAEMERLGVRTAVERFSAERAENAQRLLALAEMSADGEAQVSALIDLAVSREA